MVRAVIFDLDGTLLDSLDDLAAASNDVLEAEHLPTHPRDAYRLFVGEGVGVLVRRMLAPVVPSDEMFARCVARFRDCYARRWNEQSRPYAGVPELLSQLRHRGLTLAVLSNKPQDFTQKCVDYFFPDLHFDDIRGAREGVPRKPDPTAALDICQGLGVSPEQVVYVGDTAIDMETARSAGMIAVGVTWGFRERHELLDHGAQYLADTPEDVLRVIEEMSG